MMIRCLKILIAFFILATYPSYADVTGVSGTVSNGQSITIAGSGFGANGPTVVLFDDFEGGTVDAQLSTSVSPTVGSDYFRVQTPSQTWYDNNDVISGSLSARFDNYDYPANAHPVISFDTPGLVNEYYLSYWQLIPTGHTCPDNWKTLWFCEDDGCEGDQPNVTTSTNCSWWATFGNRDSGNWSVFHKDPLSSETNPPSAIGEWQRLQLYFKTGLSNNGTSIGYFTTSTANSDGDHTRITILDTSSTNQDYGTGMQRLHINGYVQSVLNSETVFDDIYMATGTYARARVEIGNASTYEGSSSLAMVTPTSWSATSITGVVRQGNLPTGTAWLYVTDSDGTRSSGFEVTIGAASTTPTISAGFNCSIGTE